MSKVPEEVIQDWVKNKKRISDRLNRIKKRLKKLQKQEKHFEMRLRLINQASVPKRKEHSFKGVGMAFDTVRYYCEACGASRLNHDQPHHYPSWKSVSSDCDEAKLQIEKFEKEKE